MKLMLIVGSVREGRRADQVKSWAVEHLKTDTEIDIDIADLKEVNLPFFDEPVIPSVAKDRYQNPVGTAWAQRVGAAEAFIFLTAEYNYGPTAVLKNAIDWVHEGWRNKPVGFISYGGLAGGTRAIQQLVQNIFNLKLFPTSTNVSIPFARNAFNDQNQPVHEDLNDKLRLMVTELKELQKRLASPS